MQIQQCVNILRRHSLTFQRLNWRCETSHKKQIPEKCEIIKTALPYFFHWEEKLKKDNICDLSFVLQRAGEPHSTSNIAIPQSRKCLHHLVLFPTEPQHPCSNIQEWTHSFTHTPILCIFYPSLPHGTPVKTTRVNSSREGRCMLGRWGHWICKQRTNNRDMHWTPFSSWISQNTLNKLFFIALLKIK